MIQRQIDSELKGYHEIPFVNKRNMQANEKEVSKILLQHKIRKIRVFRALY